MTLPVFYYATGTSNLLSIAGHEIVPFSSHGETHYVPGLDGQSKGFDGYIPGDVFPELLDTTLWTYDRVQYPSTTVSMNLSIELGMQYVINKITANPPPGPSWAIGGYSQGGALAHRIVAETKAGRLVDYRSSLRACVTFGSPAREAGHLFPGAPGWSGCVDIPDSTNGGHGVFPHFWPLLDRIIDTDSFVWDFANPGDTITSVGDSPLGTLLSTFVGLSLNSIVNLIPTVLGFPGFLDLTQRFTSAPPGVPVDSAGQVLATDARGTQFSLSGGGHVCYPWFPVPNANGIIPSSGPTAYQVALAYLRKVGQAIYDEMHPTVPAPTMSPTYSWSSTW